MSTKDWLEKDYYKVLGVSKDAKPDEIKKAFRKLAREFHPDQNADNAGAEARFKEISEANSILSDPAKRKEYDEARSLFGGGGFRFPGAGQGGGPSMEDLFRGSGAGDSGISDLFGNLFGGTTTRRTIAVGRAVAPTSRARSRSTSPTRSPARWSACRPRRTRPARPATAPVPVPAPSRRSAGPARAAACRPPPPAACSPSPSPAASAAAGAWWSRTRARPAPAADAAARPAPCRCGSRPASPTASASGSRARAVPGRTPVRPATCTCWCTSVRTSSSDARATTSPSPSR